MELKFGATYLHYKGTEYVPSKFTTDEATGEQRVVYSSGDGVDYDTPVKRWFETVSFDIVKLEPTIRFTMTEKPVVECVTMTRDELDSKITDAFKTGFDDFKYSVK